MRIPSHVSFNIRNHIQTSREDRLHCCALQQLCRVEMIPQHFPGLLRINRQIFTCVLAQLHILTYPQMSGILILTEVLSSHLLQTRGYRHSHCPMTGRTRKKPEPPQSVTSQGSQQPFSNYCLQEQPSSCSGSRFSLSCFLYSFSSSGRIPNVWPWFSAATKPEQACS